MPNDSQENDHVNEEVRQALRSLQEATSELGRRRRSQWSRIEIALLLLAVVSIGGSWVAVSRCSKGDACIRVCVDDTTISALATALGTRMPRQDTSQEIGPYDETIMPMTEVLNGGPRAAIRPSGIPIIRPEAEFSPDELAYVTANVPFGLPKKAHSWPHSPTRYVARKGYVLEHSSTDKIPLWVCEGVSRAQLTGSADRSDGFAPDPLLPNGKRAELRDYKGSGYDRGHMAPAGDQRRTQLLQDETFYLSNMSPQLPELNRQVWKALEEKIREWVEERDFAFVVTGGLFYDAEEDDPVTADGVIEYTTIGPGDVAVPTHFYKIIVAKADSSEWQSIAFRLEHRKYAKPYDLGEEIISIDWIEEHTGLNFMPELDPAEEHRLESSKSPMW